MAEDIRTTWKPRQGAHCRVIQNAEEKRSETPAPPGIWWCLSPAPESGWWWIQPHDAAAHASMQIYGKYPKRHVSTLRAA